MAYRDADIQPMLDEFGVLVTIAGVAAKCMVNDSDDELATGASGALVGRVIGLVAKTGTFPGATQGAVATVDYPAAGASYKVVSVRRGPPTGQLSTIVCARL